jgi:cytochrome c553
MKKINFLLLLIILNTFSLFSKDIPKLFKDVCANCHGLKGEKNDAFSAIGGMDEAKIIESLKLYKSGGDKYGMGVVMQGRVEDLSQDDMKALAKYIHSLKN